MQRAVQRLHPLVGRDETILSEPTPSHSNCLKTRREAFQQSVSAVLGALHAGKFKRHELLEFREFQRYERAHVAFGLLVSSELLHLALQVLWANEPVNSFLVLPAYV